MAEEILVFSYAFNHVIIFGSNNDCNILHQECISCFLKQLDTLDRLQTFPPEGANPEKSFFAQHFF